MSFLDLFIKNNNIDADVSDMNVGNKVRFLSLFSGIGAFEKALDNLQIPYELVGFSEIDKYAIKSYCAIHGVDESKNFGDITKVDTASLPKNIDLITYGFPCQDISLAGKQKGMFNEDGTQTRSGLFFEALRIIEATKPRIAIAENVKNLTGKKFKAQFEIVLKSLEEVGYNNYWKVLNAKDFGIPQNRERVFVVSIRKDIDDGLFRFPEGFPLELRLKDMLEDEVDEKFYLSDKAIAGFIRHAERHADRGNGFGWNPTEGNGIATTLQTSGGTRPSDNYIKEPFIAASRERNPENPSDRTPGAPTEQRPEPNSQGIANTLTTVQKDNYVVEPQMIQVGQMYGTEKEPNPQAGRIYSADGISPTMDSCSGGNRMPKVLVEGTVVDDTQGFDGTRYYDNVSPSLRANRNGLKVFVREATKKGCAEAVEGDSINLEQPNSKTRRGRVGKQVAQTLTTSPQQAVVLDE